MIRYEPHPRWLQDIVRLPVSYALRRALYGTIMMGLYASALLLTMRALGHVTLPYAAASLGAVGGVISLALAFRLNNAYARWWEGRQHWGMLVNHSRNLAALVRAMWPPSDESGRRRMAGLIGDFAVGLALHLRGEPFVDEFDGLTEDERDDAHARSHPLSFVARLVWSEIETRRANRTLDYAQVLLLQPHARALLDVLGACERIRNTPIPFAVTAAARMFLLGFTLLLPFGLQEDFSWLTIPLSMAAFFAMAAMDVLAAELENPFGIDCNDLPTRALAETIRRQAHEILDIERHGHPDVEAINPALYTKVR